MTIVPVWASTAIAVNAISLDADPWSLKTNGCLRLRAYELNLLTCHISITFELYKIVDLKLSRLYFRYSPR